MPSRSGAAQRQWEVLAEEKDPLKGKCCSVLRLRDALTIAGACASVFMA